jgi:hypothetical protein
MQERLDREQDCPFYESSTSINVHLSMSADGNVQCHLQTNGLPFEEVERQLKKFAESLQWQIDERAKCPFHDKRNPITVDLSERV